MRERRRRTAPSITGERAILTAGEPNRAVWVCPSPVPLTAGDIAAALYAYSDIDDIPPRPDRPAIIAELEFVVARIGTLAIEQTAARLAGQRPESLPACAEDTCVDNPAASRLAWCQQIARMMMARPDSAARVPAAAGQRRYRACKN